MATLNFVNTQQKAIPLVLDLDEDGKVEIISTDFSSLTIYTYTGTATNLAAPRLKNQNWWQFDGLDDQLKINTQATNQQLLSNTDQIQIPASLHFNVGLPDLRLNVPQGDHRQSVDIEVLNRGTANYDQAFSVELYAGDPAQNGLLLGSQTVTNLDMFDTRTLQFNGLVPVDFVGQLVAKISAPNPLLECQSNNNTTSAYTVDVTLSDQLGASAHQNFLLGVQYRDDRLGMIYPFTAQNVSEGDLFTADVTLWKGSGSDKNNSGYFYLRKAPKGATIDSKTGQVNWQTDYLSAGYDYAKSYHISFGYRTLIDNAEEISGTMNFDVYPSTNNKPVVTSTAPKQAFVQNLYAYDVEAKDADGDPLSYQLTQAPSDMVIDTTTGLIQWTPGTVESFHVKVTVSDGKESTTHAFTLSTLAAANQAPIITSNPVVVANVGGAYQYAVAANDPEGQVLSYSLAQAPSGMSINASTGLVQWVPASTSTGLFDVEVKVADVNDLSARQRYSVTVFDALSSVNQAPIIISNPVTEVSEKGQFGAFLNNVVAIDPENDPVSYSILQAPTSTNLNQQSGEISWPINPQFVSGNLAFNEQCLVRGDPIEDAQRVKIEPEVVWTSHIGALNRPVVAPLFDTNNDGKVTRDDKLYLIANQHTGFVDNASSWIAVIDPDTWQPLWESPVTLKASSSLAVADINADGLPEIIGFNNSPEGVVAYDNLGNLLWTNTDFTNRGTFNYSAINVVDIDGDGDVEILARDFVIDHQGNTVWQATLGSNHASQSYAVDMDLDGQFEVVISGHVYTNQGVPYLNFPDNFAQSVPINLDNDDFPEFVYNNGSNTVAMDTNGDILWSENVGNSLATPTVGDLNNDGVPEIVIISSKGLTVFDISGNTLWRSGSFYQVGASTPALIYDLDHDGMPEILAQGENEFRIYTGAGELIYKRSESSATAAEYTIAVDLDGDGFGEIINSANNGITVFKNKYDNWSNAPKIWNHYQYNPDNVNADLSPVSIPPHSWLGNNSIRAVIPKADKLLADLVIRKLTLVQGVDKTLVNMDVYNRGTADVNTVTQVKLYQGDPNFGGNLIGQVSLNSLASNTSIPIDIDVTGLVLSDNLFAVVDSGSKVIECFENNNTAVGVLFDFKASDPQGLSDQQAYLLNIRDENEAPQITSTAPSTGVQGEYYLYPIQASDNDVGDTLLYSLVTGPEGATINQETGLVRLKMVDVGSFDFVVKVTDLSSAQAQQAFTLNVSASAPINQPPVISSQAISSHVTGFDYEYQVQASDPEGEALSYQLINPPVNMTIDSNGLINWPTANVVAGGHFVHLRVTDFSGAFIDQSYLLQVAAVITNLSPVITSSPIVITTAGNAYQYQMAAADPEGTNLFYSLSQGPTGMTISSTGLIDWQSSNQNIGTHSIIIRVSDAFSVSSEQHYSLQVLADTTNNTAPVINSSPTNVINAGEHYQYQVIASDAEGDVLQYALNVFPENMTIDSQSGLIQWNPAQTQIAAHNVTVRVTDGLEYIYQSFTLTVVNGIINSAPTITSSPTFGIAVSTLYQYDVDAVDTDGDTLNYQLVTFPSGMTIDPITGIIGWKPTASQLGSHNVEVEVSDGQGASITQRYAVTVSDGSVNIFTLSLINQPVVTAFPSTHYRYRTAGFAEHGGVVNIVLISGPSGMTLSADTPFPGYYELNWIPDEANCQRDVTLELSDSFGNTSQITYTIDVYNAPKRLNRLQCRVDSAFCATR